ncbi:hypothetical protein TrVFT333_002141 [Trichoderma virens FT-333]|nr:hypothetical protein TrVFT333_002141 [Trichoderma virens FT-333]
MAVVDFLFKQFPEADPKWLTEHKTAMVSNQFLGCLCVKRGLHKHILLATSAVPGDIGRYAAQLEQSEERPLLGRNPRAVIWDILPADASKLELNPPPGFKKITPIALPVLASSHMSSPLTVPSTPPPPPSPPIQSIGFMAWPDINDRNGRWISDDTIYPLKDTTQLEAEQIFNAFKGYILLTMTKNAKVQVLHEPEFVKDQTDDTTRGLREAQVAVIFYKTCQKMKSWSSTYSPATDTLEPASPLRLVMTATSIFSQTCANQSKSSYNSVVDLLYQIAIIKLARNATPRPEALRLPEDPTYQLNPCQQN